MITKEAFDKEVQHIVDQLITRYKPEKIILFGSLARGQEEPKDIDLFILKKDPPYIGTDRIRELERLVQYTIATDFIVYTPEEATRRLALGDPFLKEIFKEGKVLYERK